MAVASRPPGKWARGADTPVEIGPAPILSLIVGVFHSALYVLIRGSAARPRLPFAVIAAVLGAYAGQALGTHLGDPIRLGDFAMLSASLMAWAGILVVALTSVLGPAREPPA